MRWFIAAGVGGLLFVGSGSQTAFGNEGGPANVEGASALLESPAPLIDKIVFVGLHHIAPAAVESQISSRPGAKLDSKSIESDVKTLGQLGWFGFIQVETQSAPTLSFENGKSIRRVQVVFRVEELPFLSKIKFEGSRLLSTSQIEKILGDKQLTPRLGEPAAPATLVRVANTIQSALAELAHPQAHVQVLCQEFPSSTVHVRFRIEDGPYIPVGRIYFEGHPEVSAEILRHEMHRTAPGALFASWRNKGAYTREGFEEDRSQLLIYYQNHGFPEARIGNVGSSVYAKKASRWMPWPLRSAGNRLAITVPVEAGPIYRFESVNISPELAAASGKHSAKLLACARAESGSAYSAKAIDNLRHAWVVAIQTNRTNGETETQRSVETTRTLDLETHLVREKIGFSEAPPYIVRRIEFRGLHRFSDRYMRRRIGLEEGQPFDERSLELGLARLTKTGYFHQIRKQDIHVQTNAVTHTADVMIQVSEAGQQRVSFSGGLGQFGSTLGIAYTIFDLLQREELFSTQIDAGPESLQLVLGLVLEGFLGSRSSLAISVFDNALRPRFLGSPKGPFYSSQSDGLNTGWSHAFSTTDSFTLNYGLSRTNSAYSFALPESFAGLPSPELRAKTSSSAAGLGWTRDTGSERISIANSVSGGVLGGSENLIRSNAEYSRILPDPFFNRRNAWAFRTILSGAGSYKGDMPIYARLFPGDSQVRGLSPGDLGPYTVVESASSSGSEADSALPAGANILGAANAEYRVTLGEKTQAAAFFDLGSGWLLPNWLGNDRPTLLGSTNGILHGSLGIELRWTVPGIQVPVRAYYAVNVLRLNRFLQLPDGSLFHAHNRLFAFGWALGTLF